MIHIYKINVILYPFSIETGQLFTSNIADDEIEMAPFVFFSMSKQFYTTNFILLYKKRFGDKDFNSHLVT